MTRARTALERLRACKHTDREIVVKHGTQAVTRCLDCGAERSTPGSFGR